MGSACGRLRITGLLKADKNVLPGEGPCRLSLFVIEFPVDGDPSFRQGLLRFGLQRLELCGMFLNVRLHLMTTSIWFTHGISSRPGNTECYPADSDAPTVARIGLHDLRLRAVFCYVNHP